MGMMDKVKQAVRGKSGKLEQGIDKAVQQVDQRTKGKYGAKLTKGSAKLKEQARKLDDERRDAPGTTGPAGTAGPSTSTGPTGTGPTSTGPTTTGTGGPGTGPTTPGPVDGPDGPNLGRDEPPLV